MSSFLIQANLILLLVCFLKCIGVAFLTNGRQGPPPAKRWRLAYLQDSLYSRGLDLSRQRSEVRLCTHLGPTPPPLIPTVLKAGPRWWCFIIAPGYSHEQPRFSTSLSMFPGAFTSKQAHRVVLDMSWINQRHILLPFSWQHMAVCPILSKGLPRAPLWTRTDLANLLPRASGVFQAYFQQCCHEHSSASASGLQSRMQVYNPSPTILNSKML